MGRMPIRSRYLVTERRCQKNNSVWLTVQNEFEATSDLDLAVEGLSLSEYGAACREIEETARLPVNLIRFEDISAGFRKIVEESGVILYDRTGKESGRFKTPKGGITRFNVEHFYP